MARFIAMRILPYHTGTENRKFLIIGRAVCEHTVKLLRKALLPAGQGHQSVNILLHRPEILPTVAFANMRRIIIWRETVYKSSPVITRLHERCLRIIYILIILRTSVEFIRYLPLTQLLGHACYTVIIVSILQGFGERPVLCICLLYTSYGFHTPNRHNAAKYILQYLELLHPKEYRAPQPGRWHR